MEIKSLEEKSWNGYIGGDSLDEVYLGNWFFVEPCQCLMYLDTKSLEKYS